MELKKVILCAVAGIVTSTSTVFAQLPSQKEILASVEKVNGYFMKKYPDPTLPTYVKKMRPSSLWTRAVYYEGLMALYAIQPRDAYFKYTYDWGEQHKWTPRNGNTTKDADDYCCSQTYIDMYRLTHDWKMIQNAIINADMIVNNPDDSDWWWIDAIQMGMPVLAKLGKTLNEPKYWNKMWDMYAYTRNKQGEAGMYNAKEGLWWRDKDFVAPYKEQDGMNCYWSRGDGWVVAALVRTIDEITATKGHDQNKEVVAFLAELKEDYLDMMKALLKCQREDGFWNVSLMSPVTYGGPETSGTALFTMGMAWGIRNGMLPRAGYRPAVDKAWKTIAEKAIHADGFIGYLQGTGKQPKDGQPVTYTSVPDFEDYGAGCVLLGAVEYYKMLQTWPDGTVMSEFFSNTRKVNVAELGKQYVITDYGVKNDSTLLQTEAIQAVIDRCSEEGGGVVVIPKGTFLTGSLFFKKGTHLHVSGRLKGSDRIRDFKLMTTRMEGQTLKYFAAMINADGVDGFTITGDGAKLDGSLPSESGFSSNTSCIDGNGYLYWEEFRYRRQYNPECTNLEAMRPRLVYISNSKDVTVQDVYLINSPFWTNHLYRCSNVRYLDCFIYAPTKGVVIKGSDKQYGAPSSDAIDLDVCHDVLVHGCFMQVNDDAVVIKGGKGTWADQNPDNGPVYNVLVDDCVYGRVHGCLTVGSESIDDWNIVIRNIKFNNADRVLWLKMRPDTPQQYRLISVENVSGTCGSFLVIRPWTQFYNLGDRKDMPLSHCCDVTIRDIDVESKNFFDVGTSDKYELSNFTFENCKVKDKKGAFDASLINGCKVSNMRFY